VRFYCVKLGGFVGMVKMFDEAMICVLDGHVVHPIC
jgi:hypothetical protein